MVKLNRIYTKTGDDGTTGLGDGSRVPKTSARVEAYGTVDEANASLGVAALQAGPGGTHSDIAELVKSIQHDLFDVGADLCVPIKPGEGDPGAAHAKGRLRATPEQTARLERAIDRFNERLKPLNSFVLPGGTPLAAALHVARTVVRRAERCTVALQRAEPAATNDEAVRYLNRLSDLLFVLARVANDDGAADVLWVPGANRPK
jgi:cob(I)alamin adenosyltransferase